MVPESAEVERSCHREVDESAENDCVVFVFGFIVFLRGGNNNKP